MSIEISKTTGSIPPDVLYSALRRVFYKFSCGGVVHEKDFVSTCGYVSTLLKNTEFQNLIESTQGLFVDVVEMAVVVFISRVFPIVRLSILSFVDYIPESCEAVSSLFDSIEAQVTKCCGYDLQLRMAAIDQLLQSDETMVTTFPKTLNLSLFAEKCRSMPFTTSSDDYNLQAQPSSQFLDPLPSASGAPLSRGTISPSIGCSPPRECPFPTWSTPRSSFLVSHFTTDSFRLQAQSYPKPNFNVVQSESVRAAAEFELSLCANLLFGSNMQASMQSQSHSIAENKSNAPSPVSQTFSVDMKSLLPSNVEHPMDSPLFDPLVLDEYDPATVSQSPPIAESQSYDHPVSSPLLQQPLQIHDHSQQSSIDLALVPSELLSPYLPQSHSSISLLRRPLLLVSPSNLCSILSVSALNDPEPCPPKLSRAEAEDLFGYPASSSPAHADHQVESSIHPVNGDVSVANIISSIGPITAQSVLDPDLNEPVFNPVPEAEDDAIGEQAEVKTPTKEKRKRQSSIAGSKKGVRKEKSRSASVVGLDIGKALTEEFEIGAENRASPRYGAENLRRSKRQRTVTNQKRGLDVFGLGSPFEGTASPGRRSSSKVNKENTR
ncbi:hypothetical protein F5876DRAFT_80716 [Lentinula aff. lateritia]|uniref:Uncharacterized protein n=1 Tax=Lentinula aff. lateritia TaxID=2804960 RepID=A0ACC1TNX3_9AGAR|nr:hypothetical protein F5876DRAFT_80716 [Lentinula aff. lateritia]